MEIKLKGKLKGTYDFELQGPQGTHYYRTHNIPCRGITGPASYYRSWSHDYEYAGRFLKIGTGAGVPSAADTDLFETLWTIEASKCAFSMTGPDSARGVYTFILPATSQYVADITEVGLYNREYGITTHAMLADAEGQPVVIHKTVDDVLTITVTMEMTVSLPSYVRSSLDYYSKESKPTNFAGYMLASRYSYGEANKLIWADAGDPWPFTPSVFRFSLNLTNCLVLNKLDDRDVPRTDPASLGWKYVLEQMQMSIKDTIRVPPETPRNNGYYRYIQLASPSGYTWRMCPLPFAIDLKSDIFPAQQITGIPIEGADGKKKEFRLPLNYFLKDSEKIYKNGIQLQRGVDYTIDNAANAACWQEVEYITDGSKGAGDVSVTAGPDYMDYAILMFAADRRILDSRKFDRTKVASWFSNKHPLVIDWGAPHLCDTLRLCGTYDSDLNKLVVEYANNAEGPWQAVIEPVQTKRGIIRTSISWKGVSARYWRLRFVDSGTACVYSNSSNIELENDEQGFPITTFLGHRNLAGLVFTTPPAAEDVITMDCQSDVLFKNDKFAAVLDLDWQISFS